MPQSADEAADGGFAVAVAAESLYLVNLLLLPGVGFLLLLVLWWRKRQSDSALARSHLAQTLSGSIWAGFLLIAANALILILGGYDGAWTWVVMIIYFTVCHALLIFFGAYGLAKAMAAQCWRYPLVGRPLPEGCPGRPRL